jgi:alkaline phosphatase D
VKAPSEPEGGALARRAFLRVTAAGALAAVGCGEAVPAAGAGDGGGDLGQDTLADAVTADAAPDGVSLDGAIKDAQDAVDAQDATGEFPEDAVVVEVGGPDPLAGLVEVPEAFPLHVMAGDMDATSAVLWTRLATRVPLSLRVLELADDGGVARVAFDGPVTPDADGYTHQVVRALRPARRHRYAFTLRRGGAEVRSPLGRFRTAPAEDASAPVTFAATSCTHQRARPFPTMAHAAARDDLDFFVHAGDMVYCDGARTYGDYRDKYQENWTSAGLRALFSSAGLYTTWDDHEVDNNYNPETLDPAQFTAARMAYFAHRAQRRDPAEPNRLWRSARWGRTLELFLLDARSERRPSTRRTPGAQYLSPAQLTWLLEGLSRSPARFKVIVNSVPIANFPLFFDLAAQDRWEGYASQRNALLDRLATVPGAWFLSGDFHLGCVARVEPSGPRSMLREVLCGPGGNNPNALWATLLGPQFEFVTPEHNYTVFRLDPARGSVDLSFVDGAGRELVRRVYDT